MARFEVPGGWSLQAFSFALDPDQNQAQVLARQFGGRRYACNWAVRQLKDGIEAYHAGLADPDAGPPSFYGLRQRWNQAKRTECIDRETGEAWWPEISKEAFADGIRGAVDGYWRGQKSRNGEIEGKRAGFPGSSARAATRTGSRSRPARCGSTRTAARWPCLKWGPSGPARTPAGWSG